MNPIKRLFSDRAARTEIKDTANMEASAFEKQLADASAISNTEERKLALCDLERRMCCWQDKKQEIIETYATANITSPAAAIFALYTLPIAMTTFTHRQATAEKILQPASDKIEQLHKKCVAGIKATLN